MFLSDPSNIAAIAGLLVLAHAPTLPGKRAEIMKIRDQFQEWLVARASGKKVKPVAVDAAFTKDAVATVGVIGGLDVLLATSILSTAIEQSIKLAKGDKALAARQGKVLHEALQEALDVLTTQAVTLEPGDALYDSAIERLAKK